MPNCVVRLIPLLLASLIASCSWMTTAPLPLTAIPMQFNSSDSSYASVESLPYLAWWQQFNDPQLNDLIESGLVNNLDLNIAMSNLEQAKGQLLQVELSWIPFISLYAGFSTNPGFGDIGTFYGAWPQYTLNIAHVIEQQRQAQYNVSMRKVMVDGARLTLIGQISAAYFTLIAQQQQIILLDQLDSDSQQLITFSRQEKKIGLQTNIDVSQTIVNEKLIQAQLNIARHNIVLSQNSLHYLLNQNPGKINSTNNFAKLDFSKFKPGSLPSTVLHNRPDLKMSEYALQAAHAGVGVDFSKLFPIVQLDEFLGAASGNGTYRSPTNYSTMTDMYLTSTIDPTVFGEVEAQKGAYHAEVYQYIQTVRKIMKDTDNSYSANVQFTQNYTNTFSAWTALHNKYELQRGLYKSGIMSYPELLTNKLDLDNLALSLNQSKLQQAMSLVSLYQELAGGYKYKPELNKPQ